MNQNYDKLIAATEAAFEARIKQVADDILDKKTETVLIAGGSCVGKTPVTIKLCKFLSQSGITVHTVSLDDFYRFGDECVYLPDGTKDIESINSLRLDLISDMLHDIADKKSVLSLPRFDFNSRARIDDDIKIKRTEKDLFIIEGLHAHNPIIADAVSGVYKLYLYTQRQDCDFNPRLVRRIVRDSIYRASPASETLLQWNNVIAEEQKSIAVFAKKADASINTYFEYERGIFNSITLAQLALVSPNHEYDGVKSEIIQYLDGAGDIPIDAVPPNSLMKEFV